MPSKINISGQGKDISGARFNVQGSSREVSQILLNVGGLAKEIFSGKKYEGVLTVGSNNIYNQDFYGYLGGGYGDAINPGNYEDGVAIANLSANQDFSDRCSLAITFASTTRTAAELGSIAKKINKVVVGSFVVDLKALKSLGKTFHTSTDFNGVNNASLSISHNDPAAVYSVARDFHAYLKARNNAQLSVVIR